MPRETRPNEQLSNKSLSPIFTQRFHAGHGSQFSDVSTFILALTADERMKSRHHFEAVKTTAVQGDVSSHDLQIEAPSTEARCGIYLQLPRGTVLRHNDCLMTDHQDVVLYIVAKPEPVMTAIAPTPLALLKAAYHLGNRHVSLEVSINHLRFAPDPVLKQMVERMGLTVTKSIMPFQPEVGAYADHGVHSHPIH